MYIWFIKYIFVSTIKNNTTMLKEDFLKIYQKGVEPVRDIHMSNINDVVVSDRFGNLFVWNEGLVIIYKCKPSELSPDMLSQIKTSLFLDELPEFDKFISLSNEQKDELGVPSLWYGFLWEDNYLDDYVVSSVSKRV